MPIYEYRCESCQHELEALQKLSDPVLIDCPECTQATLKKQLSAPGFRLSGSGWYETDFKTGEKKKNLAGDKEPKKDKGDKKSDGGDKSGGKKAETKTKSKPKSDSKKSASA